MIDAVSLLPSNATAWETAHELTDAARFALIDPDHIRRQKDPLLCEPAVLPLLAWERSVDLWHDDWALAKKRDVVDRWSDYERLKGTPEGHRRFQALVGSEIRRVIRPPQTLYARRGWNEPERIAYLAQFQQIRIYPRVPVREFQRGFFVASPARSRAFVGREAPTAYRETIDAFLREARLFDPATATETALTRRQIVREVTHVGTVYQFEDIVLPARRRGLYVGDHLDGRRFLNADDANERVVRTEIARPNQVAVSRPQYSAVVPSGRLISIEPDLIRDRFVDDGPFFGRASTGLRSVMYCKRDLAWRHVYERFHLYDRRRDKGITAGEPGLYVGRARLGMAPYTAEIKVAIRGRRLRHEFANFSGGYLTRPDRTPLLRAIEAARVGKSARDTIRLDTLTRRKLRFGNRITFGDHHRFGAKLEA